MSTEGTAYIYHCAQGFLSISITFTAKIETVGGIFQENEDRIICKLDARNGRMRRHATIELIVITAF